MGSHLDSAANSFFTVDDAQLTDLKDKVILVTGGSSGMGLAAVQICLKIGAKVIVGDINNCPEKHENLVFQKCDVADWNSQVALFKTGVQKFGQIDHVFANAGIGPVDNFVTDKLDSNGELLPPNMKCMRINLDGPIYTCKLGAFYLRKNSAENRSVVITASASSFSPFEAADYGTAKHGTLGLCRNLSICLARENIRVNCITPLWTATGLVPAKAMEQHVGIISQPPEAAARSALICMVDTSRNSQAIYSRRSELKDVNGILMSAILGAMDVGDKDRPVTEEQQKNFSKYVISNGLRVEGPD